MQEMFIVHVFTVLVMSEYKESHFTTEEFMLGGLVVREIVFFTECHVMFHSYFFKKFKLLTGV